MNKTFLAAGAAVILSLGTATATAQTQNYPSRALNWIVPLAPGGPADTLTRTVADKLGGQLKTSIVIENVAGAGGTIGAAKGATVPADGYHFLVSHMGIMGAAPSLYKALRYDPVKDFSAVIRFPDTPAVLLVNKDSPYQTLEELVKAAKEKPEGLLFGTAGVGSVSHLVAELFASELGVKIQPVPFRGNAPAVAELMSGRIDAVFDQSNTAMATVEGGRVRALGVGSQSAMPQFPNVPPIASVIPNFEATTWYGLYAPAGTPRAAIDHINQAYLTLMDDSAFREELLARGLYVQKTSELAADSFQALTKAEVERWAQVVKAAGIPPQ